MLFVFLGLSALTSPAQALGPTYLFQWGGFGAAPGRFGFPVGLAVNSVGEVVVSDWINERVQRFDRFGGFLGVVDTPAMSGPFHVSSVCLDNRDGIWVANRADNKIYSFDRNGALLGTWPATGTATAVAVAWSKSKIFVLDQSSCAIFRYREDGTFEARWGTLGAGPENLNFPFGVAASPVGHIVVTDTYNHRVVVYDENGSVLSIWGRFGSAPGEFSLPINPGLDRNGNVYVSDSANDRVQVFTPDGILLYTFGSSGAGNGEFDQPAGVAVSDLGEIYVSDYTNGRVQCFGAGAVATRGVSWTRLKRMFR